MNLKLEFLENRMAKCKFMGKDCFYDLNSKQIYRLVNSTIFKFSPKHQKWVISLINDQSNLNKGWMAEANRYYNSSSGV